MVHKNKLDEMNRNLAANPFQALLQITSRDAIAGFVVRTKRKKLSYGTDELHRLSGMSASSLSRIENGTKSITADELKMLEIALPGLTADLRSVHCCP